MEPQCMNANIVQIGSFQNADLFKSIVAIVAGIWHIINVKEYAEKMECIWKKLEV